MLSEPKPLIRPYLPDQVDPDDRLLTLDLESCLADYIRDRANLTKRLRELTPEEWNVTAEHGEYNRYSVFIMFRHLALHDFLHGYRIEELLLQKL